MKQRQERIGSSATRNDQNEQNVMVVETFWPKIEDVKYLEVTDQLPVSAFGCSIPKLIPRYLFIINIIVFYIFLLIIIFSEFNLPWLNDNSNVLFKKVVPTTKRTTSTTTTTSVGRRKNSKR